MAEHTENYYDILEVSPRASAEVLRAAYKSLMQRHHPDKHGADSRMAQRASLIAQAYGVLSDSAQRAAYDARLAQQNRPRPTAPISTPILTPGYTRRAAAPRSNWYFWLLAAVLLACAAAMWQLSGKKAPARAEFPSAQPAASQSPAAKPDASAAAPAPSDTSKPAAAASPLRIALLGNDLRVVLVSTETLPENAEASRHILTIPALTVDIAPADAERFASALTQHKEAVLAQLADKLAYASYPDLKIDGDLYLARYILEALRDISTAQGLTVAQASGSDTPRAGIVAVSLPASFGLR